MDFLYYGQPWPAWDRGGTRPWTSFTVANLDEPGLEEELSHILPSLWPTLARLGSRGKLAMNFLPFGHPWRAWTRGENRPWTPFILAYLDETGLDGELGHRLP